MQVNFVVTCHKGPNFLFWWSKSLHCWHQEDAMVTKEVLLDPVHLSTLGQGTNKSKQEGTVAGQKKWDYANVMKLLAPNTKKKKKT